MTRRSGFTLIEALMAVFVMAIGLLALLTLFPLGAMQFQKAIKDQRSAESANNAIANCKTLGFANGALPMNLTPYPTADPFKQPFPGWRTIRNGGSYPIYVDQWGYQSALPAVGGLTPLAPQGVMLRLGVALPVIPATVPPTTVPIAAADWFELHDDMVFGNNGIPQNTAPVSREGRYTWAYILRRGQANQVSSLPLDVTIVVYAGRGVPTSTGPLVDAETVFNASFSNPAGNIVTVTWPVGTDRPRLRRGNWIMDGRMQPVPQGYMYRVVSITETSANSLDLEVQTPLGGPLRSYGASGPTDCIVVMDNVVEVFERGTNYGPPLDP
jgi:type II secretory pathway pseudopilin PulG